VSDFWKSDTYLIVEAMKDTGNSKGVIARWKELVEDWAERSTSPDAAAVLAWLPHWQPRPFYTATELAPIFPALSVALRFAPVLGRTPPQKSPARLRHELEYARLPFVIFLGAQYFIVERCHYWSSPDRTEQELLNAYNGVENALG
jgi:hypothetical protein